jgi:HKD family nuclease
MIAISLRTSRDLSYFRRNLISILSYPDFTSVVICSGYFQENYNGSEYGILNDGLLSIITANPNYKKIEYIIVGGKFSNSTDPWKTSFNNFLSGLTENGINYKAFVDPRGKWHAKISIGIENTKPKTVLLGSSNMTRPAFGESNSSFNIEADILLLANELKLRNHFNIEETSSQNPLSQIVAQLDTNIDQANTEQRIIAIYNTLINDVSLQVYRL